MDQSKFNPAAAVIGLVTLIATIAAVYWLGGLALVLPYLAAATAGGLLTSFFFVGVLASIVGVGPTALADANAIIRKPSMIALLLALNIVVAMVLTVIFLPAESSVGIAMATGLIRAIGFLVRGLAQGWTLAEAV